MDRARGCEWRGARVCRAVERTSMLTSGWVTLVIAGALPTAASSQQPVATPSLVFDGVTVVDVAQGKLLRGQRVVIVGNRIQAVGAAGVVKTPQGAQRVDARGKYLIPRLWDLHVHPFQLAEIFDPLFIANGVTGISDGPSPRPVDT